MLARSPCIRETSWFNATPRPRLDLVEGSRVDNPSPPFRDITDAVGFHFNRSDANSELRQDIIDTRASLIDSGLSVVDWNDDGLVTESMNHSVLFRNDGKGGFVREPLPIEDRRLVPSQLLCVDLDGDGLDELVSNRVLYREGHASMGIHFPARRLDGAPTMGGGALQHHALDRDGARWAFRRTRGTGAAGRRPACLLPGSSSARPLTVTR